MGKLVIKHLTHPVQDLRIVGVSVIREGRFHKHGIQSGRVMRPIRSMRSGRIESRMGQISLQSIGLDRDLVLHKIPTQAYDAVVGLFPDVDVVVTVPEHPVDEPGELPSGREDRDRAPFVAGDSAEGGAGAGREARPPARAGF